MTAQSNNHFRLISLKDQRVVADKCVEAVSFVDRLKGLIGKKELRVFEGVYFARCNSLHMYWMSIPIDVVFVAEEQTQMGERLYRITSLKEDVKPWKLLPLLDFKANGAFELGVGTIQKSELKIGEVLCTSCA